MLRRLKFLTVAGVHAPTATAAHILYGLCVRPEYFAALREELHEGWAAENGRWALGVQRRLRKLDGGFRQLKSTANNAITHLP
ncbi:hypothetical protein N7G274_003790 [Stereocaulon virgatum]|uniref:Uncharacterized protein n=1 Tax=Stereocaulon virgatum TaxID=373712 RepID=A0ABR4ACH6_9LECA